MTSLLTHIAHCFCKRALQVYPNCPGAVRLGIGLCRYKLGQFQKARQAFQRVLEVIGSINYISFLYECVAGVYVSNCNNIWHGDSSLCLQKLIFAVRLGKC